MAENALPGRALPRAFFERDTVTVARELLGMTLVSRTGGTLTGGRIVECEAYLGAHDPGSHASTKGITARNAVMFGPPGRAYVYFTYGNHHMLNIVTESDGVAGAVLVRALEPTIGIDEMLRRRSARRAAGRLTEREIANGPGKLASALAIDLTANDTPMQTGTLVVCDTGAAPGAITSSGRVGLSDGHELELRFYIEGSPFVSRGRIGPKAPRSGGRKVGG